MQSRISLFLFVCLAASVPVGFAQQATTSPQGPVSADKESIPAFPYIAQITDDNVNIRSGPGTNYYPCGKLNKTDKVTVIGSQFSWSRIVPPPGSFSWISIQYVKIDPNNPDIGTVTGDAVRVYAGSDYIKPIHSTTMQVKLDTGDKVRLMGEEEGDYYKITPPSSVYLWVSTKYTKPLGPVEQVPVTVRPKVEPKAKPKARPTTDTGTVVPTKVSVESEKLKEYYALEKQIHAERAKPVVQQNYAVIKKKLLKIAGDKGAGKAARYSDFALKQIKRFELVLDVEKAVRLQDAHLQQTKDGIEKARATRLTQVPDLGKFIAVGQFQTSKVYGPEAELIHYRIIDDSGKTVCYALPNGPASKMDLSKLVNRKVGLVGTVEPHPQTAGALVRFTEITELN